MSTPTPLRSGVACSLALLAACSDGAGREERRENDTARAVSTQAASAPDACEVLSEAEVAALAGEAVTARAAARGGPTWSGCEWFGRTTETPYLGLTVYWSGGREQWEIQGSGYAIAKEAMGAAEGADLDSIVKPGPVAGLGDAAIFADLMPAVVLEGDRMVELMVFHLPGARAKFRPLAAKVLERIRR
jgi:hypothetical protein